MTNLLCSRANGCTMRHCPHVTEHSWREGCQRTICKWLNLYCGRTTAQARVQCEPVPDAQDVEKGDGDDSATSN